MSTRRVPLSVLDLVPVSAGQSLHEALDASLEQVKLADQAGFQRYWYAEHHNADAFASSATSLLIGRAAENTSRITVGSGGVMLPNHSPLMVAEYYGTLAQMYPGRIELGLGRAPGTDPMTAAALRRGQSGADSFVQDLADLHRWFDDADKANPAIPRAIPGADTHVPLWMLGSSLDGATIAAHLGLPYAFASHFAPQLRHQALARYRERFSTEAFTASLEKPYAMAAVNVLVAPTDDEAQFLFTTAQQMAAAIRTGKRTTLQPPVADLTQTLGPDIAAFVEDFQAVRAVGSPQTVVAELEAIVADLGVDELIVTTYAYDPALRLRSFELLAQAWME